MGGDGLDGLAAAIFGAMICMVLLPALLLGGVGYLVLRGRRGWIGAVIGVVLGVVLGALSVVGTFFESTWSPPPTLTLEVPSGFAHEWVYVIADPRITTEVAWSGHDLPFTSRHAELAVPASGVVRVRSLDGLERGDLAATLGGPGGGGASLVGFSAMSPRPDVGPGRILALGFARGPITAALLPEDPDVLSARLTESTEH